MYVDKFDAADGLCGFMEGLGLLGDYYDPETGLMISSPFDSAAGPGGVVSPNYPVVSTAPIGLATSPPANSQNWLSSILAPFTKAASTIAVAQFGQPNLQPGTFIRGADGSILTNQPITGGGVLAGSSLFGATGGLSGMMMPIILIGGALILFGGRK
jgi:hypothetical protein